MSKLTLPNWNNRPISDPTHTHDLEQKAAMLEFNHKLPKEQAEDQAYSEYKREQHVSGAANHFAGMQAAKATGDRDEVKKHHAMYMLHMQELGHDPVGPLPKEVEAKLGEAKAEPHYSFHAHKSDAFLLKSEHLEKALPRSQAENIDNAKGFLSDPVAMDSALENTKLTPKDPPVWTGVEGRQRRDGDNLGLGALRARSHNWSNSNDTTTGQFRNAADRQRYNPDDVGHEPHSSTAWIGDDSASGPEKPATGSPADQNEAKRFWGGLKTSLKTIRANAAGKSALQTMLPMPKKP